MKPHWPAMMKRATAAAYLDMSEASFMREVGNNRLPRPILLGGRDHWRKDALDTAIAKLDGAHDDEPQALKDLRKRYGQAA